MTKQIEPHLAEAIDAYANQCVKCALCLPHCPTYALQKDENESPRGRIALFQAISKQQLPLSPQIQTHLDQCLGCRACERVCPAHVQYGLLLTKGRALLQALPHRTKKPHISRILAFLVRHPTLLKLLHWGLYLLEATYLRAFAKKFRLINMLRLSSLDTLLPPVSKPLSRLQKAYAALNTKQGAIALFTGCMTPLGTPDTVLASIYVLRQLGFDVCIPKNQNCCGAIALHAGNAPTAQNLAKQNLRAFQHTPSFIVTLATGCNLTLQEYEKNFSLDSNFQATPASMFSNKIIDILSFLQQCHWPEHLTLQPVKAHILLHTPCTAPADYKNHSHPYALITQIPGITYQYLDHPYCCGAAGLYMLEHPMLAKALAEALLSSVQGSQADYLVTANIGCALHLQPALKALGTSVKVCHPVVLLAKALGF